MTAEKDSIWYKPFETKWKFYVFGIFFNFKFNKYSGLWKKYHFHAIIITSNSDTGNSHCYLDVQSKWVNLNEILMPYSILEF